MLLIPVIAIVTGCSEEKKYKIGVSQCSQDDWRMKLNDEINREIMFHEDATVEIRSANDDNDKQIADIKYFVDNGFDIIIVAPNEAAPLTPAIREVYDKGIPVIIFDRNIIGDTYTARIGADNEGMGKSAARYALHLLGPDARAIEIYGLPGSTPAEGRHKGFTENFKAGGGVLVESVIGNWNKDDAERVTDSILKKYDDIDLIYAHNDRMAIGASEVAARLGRRGDIKIIGIDAAPEIGIQAVADSLIDATFLYPTEGHRLIRTALTILKGEPFKKETILPVASAVDLSNADILLLQNDAIKEETNKMRVLKRRIDDYWARHSSQTSLFYASIVIIVLLFGVVFLVLRAYWQHKHHQKILLEQNKILEEERDKQKQLNARLEDAIQSKLVFYTNVSHDLRTPLTLISEPVAQLAAADNLTPRQHNLIRIADKNVRILRRLINQILDFRKYENNKLSLHLSETDIVKSVSDWVDSFTQLARDRRMKLCFKAEEGIPESMAVDAEKFERIVFNLVSNAFKYTPDGGTIDVTCSLAADGNFMLKVADTGEGISERDLGNIFDRFYQVDRVHPNGSGIGLSLCKAFAELHGGSIHVESTLNKGSVFTVLLPIRHVADTSRPAAVTITGDDIAVELGEIEVDAAIQDDRPVALVIDDNRDIRTLMRELLSEKYNIITAANGAEGIRKAVKYVPDLIICDVMMPGIDGLECCRRLKEEVTTSHIPILMLTACSLDEQRVQGYESGADGYLSKPFSSAVLLSRCESLIANRKRIRELWQNHDSRIASASPGSDNADAGNDSKAKESRKKKIREAVSDIDSDFYAGFLEIFNKEMGNSELSVDAISAKMGLERTQFYRKIKALTNFSPVELIRHLRLKEGQNLIKTTDMSMSEIAYKIGFSTPAYFTKCYREAFGETPTDTRNKLK